MLLLGKGNENGTTAAPTSVTGTPSSAPTSITTAPTSAGVTTTSFTAGKTFAQKTKSLRGFTLDETVSKK